MSQIKLFGNTRTRSAASAEETPERRPRSLRWITVLLVILAILEGAYFFCVYSNVKFIKDLRTTYIQTAMRTMRHQWLATALIPSPIIQEAMEGIYGTMEDQIGKESHWQITPINTHPEKPADTGSQPSDAATAPEVTLDPEEEAFYQLFWELDRDSMEAYIRKHPDTLDNGWDGIKINEAGLDDDGTDIRTIMDEQVLAIDVPNQILLLRVEGGGVIDQYIGVLAVAKDPSRLSVKNSAYLGGSGQYAGTIAANNNGILAMSASGFIDNEGHGNGGALAGYAMSDGVGQGAHMGWGYKRIELREDNYLYITDSQSKVHEDCTDAVEFMPALVLDGEVLINDSTRFWGDMNPRSIIGQSDLGEILMLCVEGRQPGRSMGTGVIECGHILERHNCMQAMNLDGGSSTIMWYDGEYIIKCSNGYLEGRQLPNAFIYERADGG